MPVYAIGTIVKTEEQMVDVNSAKDKEFKITYHHSDDGVSYNENDVTVTFYKDGGIAIRCAEDCWTYLYKEQVKELHTLLSKHLAELDSQNYLRKNEEA